MADNTMKGSTYVDGNLSCKQFTPPTGSIGNNAIAVDGLDRNKLDHEHQVVYSQESSIAVVTKRFPVWFAQAAAVIVNVRASTTNVACTGNATITIQIKKNGTNILSADLVLDSGNTVRVPEAAAGFTSTALAQNDHLEVDVTANAGTGALGQGLLVIVTLEMGPTS